MEKLFYIVGNLKNLKNLKFIKMALYFKGGKGIKNPIDYNGNEIKEGDILTHSWFGTNISYITFFKEHLNIIDLEEIEKRVHKPSVIVKYNEEKGFFYGEGLENNKNLKTYMHDFMFNKTKIYGK